MLTEPVGFGLRELTRNFSVLLADSLFLLRFLRHGKFSQLRAREVLENFLLHKTEHPKWRDNTDMADPEILSIIKTGWVDLPCLPGCNMQSQSVVQYKRAMIGQTSQLESQKGILRLF